MVIQFLLNVQIKCVDNVDMCYKLQSSVVSQKQTIDIYRNRSDKVTLFVMCSGTDYHNIIY